MAMDNGYDGFFEARTARNIAMGGGAADQTVLTEINEYRTEITTAVQSGYLNLILVGTTPITSYDNYLGANTSSYYDEWAGSPKNGLTQDQLNTREKAKETMFRAIGWLNRLGYSVSRARDGSNQRLQLTISW
jgi:hypothetical protein